VGFFASSGILNRRGFFGGVFAPSNIAGLQLWLDATIGLFDTSTGGNKVTTNGSSIARWEDQSGNANHAIQVNAVNQFVLQTLGKNNKNTVKSDGNYRFMNVNQITSLGTFFIVLKQTTYKDFGVVLNSTTNFGFHSNSNGNYMYPSDFISNENLNGSSVTVPVYPSALKLFDGVFKVFDGDTTGWNLKTISSEFQSPNGEYAEIVVYNSNLTSSQKNLVRNYLNSKWALY